MYKTNKPNHPVECTHGFRYGIFTLQKNVYFDTIES